MLSCSYAVGIVFQLELMSAALSSDGEYVDWRTFLLAAAQPWPQPTQTQLLDTLALFADMDTKKTGYVTREQYDRVRQDSLY